LVRTSVFKRRRPTTVPSEAAQRMAVSTSCSAWATAGGTEGATDSATCVDGSAVTVARSRGASRRVRALLPGVPGSPTRVRRGCPSRSGDARSLGSASLCSAAATSSGERASRACSSRS
jgi:hypothetical protein